MKFCDINHLAICFAGNVDLDTCPLCSLQKENLGLSGELFTASETNTIISDEFTEFKSMIISLCEAQNPIINNKEVIKYKARVAYLESILESNNVNFKVDDYTLTVMPNEHIDDMYEDENDAKL